MVSAGVATGSETDQVASRAAIGQGAPRRRDGLRCRSFDDEAVLYDVAHNAVHYLNRTAYFIWSCCDGRRNLDEIVGMVTEAFEVDPAWGEPADRVRRDVLATLTELAANGLVDSDSWMNHGSASSICCS